LDAYDHLQYDVAEKSLQSLIVLYPGSPLLEDVQWMLGQTYERRGDEARALSEYRTFHSNYPESPRRAEAELRINLLQAMLQNRPPKKTHRFIRGIELEGKLPAGLSLTSSEVENFRSRDFNALVLAVDINDNNINLLDVPSDKNFWLILRVVVAPDDLFRIETRKSLTSSLEHWAEEGIQAVFFDIQKKFSRGDIPVELRERFVDEFRPEGGVKAPIDKPSLRWQWLGWRSREMMRIMKDLIHPILEKHPHFDWGILFPIETVTTPHLAMADTGLDLLEAKRLGVDYFGIRGTDGRLDPDLVAAVSDRIGEPVRIVLVKSLSSMLSANEPDAPVDHGFLYLRESTPIK
jgi:hypothetical protein